MEKQVNVLDRILGNRLGHTHPEVVSIYNTLSSVSGNSGGGMTWEILETSGNAVAGHGYFIDATSGVVPLTLPLNPVINDQVGIRVLDISYTVSVLGNGKNIENSAADLIINVPDTGITLGYSKPPYDWVVINN
jgi:hypothetical protein